MIEVVLRTTIQWWIYL